jgi:hypothetical protein
MDFTRIMCEDVDWINLTPMGTRGEHLRTDNEMFGLHNQQQLYDTWNALAAGKSFLHLYLTTSVFHHILIQSFFASSLTSSRHLDFVLPAFHFTQTFCIWSLLFICFSSIRCTWPSQRILLIFMAVINFDCYTVYIGQSYICFSLCFSPVLGHRSCAVDTFLWISQIWCILLG